MARWAKHLDALLEYPRPTEVVVEDPRYILARAVIAFEGVLTAYYNQAKAFERLRLQHGLREVAALLTGKKGSEHIPREVPDIPLAKRRALELAAAAFMLAEYADPMDDFTDEDIADAEEPE